jgi:hypothetical protein
MGVSVTSSLFENKKNATVSNGESLTVLKFCKKRSCGLDLDLTYFFWGVNLTLKQDVQMIAHLTRVPLCLRSTGT